MQWAILFYMLFSISPKVNAQHYYFKESQGIKEAYDYAINLKLERAQNKLDWLKISEPENLLIYHIENYIDLFTLFIKEEESDFKSLAENKNIRISQIRKGPDDSPYKLFSEAEINLQWALARLKFGEEFDAAREVYRAYALLEENQQRFPDFIANKKSLGILHALAESIPSLIRKVMGIKGSVQEGTDEIYHLVKYIEKNDFLFEKEVIAIYSYILFYQKNQRQKAYNFLKKSSLKPDENPLSTFLMAGMAQRNGHNEEAIKILKNRPHSPDFLPFYYLDFMMGKSLLSKLDPSSVNYLENFIKNFKGRHFIKEAYQKLAWYQLVQNDNYAAYKSNMLLCQNKGYDLVDEDKQALKEADEEQYPNNQLLKTRLLFDGGYYADAYQILAKNSFRFDKNSNYRLEYLYRLARVLHELKNYPEALDYYKMTIEEGDNKDYYACNAALQTGLIYEEQGEVSNAKKYFDKCLSIKPKDYKNSLHQKAKSGISRIKK
jgi:tetratricopeptide (TPR) repeat protein